MEDDGDETRKRIELLRSMMEAGANEDGEKEEDNQEGEQHHEEQPQEDHTDQPQEEAPNQPTADLPAAPEDE